ncbi:MAG TPA: hypothetical protein DCQ06_10235, partial [Myxococcales bacterium]|nr:hypothetical protein [Myxococcales bacterium]
MPCLLLSGRYRISMRVHPAIDRASAPALLKHVICMAVAVVTAAGCAHQSERSVDRFWLHAAPKVRVILKPALTKVTPGSTRRVVIRGAVRRQVGVAGGGYRLELDQPKSSLTYHLGANRQLPLITGA